MVNLLELKETVSNAVREDSCHFTFDEELVPKAAMEVRSIKVMKRKQEVNKLFAWPFQNFLMKCLTIDPPHDEPLQVII